MIPPLRAPPHPPYNECMNKNDALAAIIAAHSNPADALRAMIDYAIDPAAISSPSLIANLDALYSDPTAALALRALDELITDAHDDLNDDDFADFAEMIINDEHLDLDPSDTANFMITICDATDTAH